MTETDNHRRRLLDAHELAETAPPEAIRLPLELVDANPANPRAELPEVDVLAENIKVFGLLQPVIVRRAADRYELLGGHRRRAAFGLLREREPDEIQWRSIPAVVRSADDDQALLMLISSEVHTRAWRPREEAAALERLLLAGRDLKQIGEAVSRSESWASKRLRVYSDSVLSGYVQSGRLPATVAEELLPITDPETRRQYAERASTESWTQVDAKRHSRALRLDVEISQLGRAAARMVDVLSQIEASRIPIGIFRDLQVLRGRIEVLAAEARGEQRRLPTIEQAEAAAGVTPRRKARDAAVATRRQRAARTSRRARK